MESKQRSISSFFGCRSRSCRDEVAVGQPIQAAEGSHRLQLCILPSLQCPSREGTHSGHWVTFLDDCTGEDPGLGLGIRGCNLLPFTSL